MNASTVHAKMAGVVSTSMEVTDATVFKVMTDDTAIKVGGPFASYGYLILNLVRQDICWNGPSLGSRNN